MLHTAILGHLPPSSSIHKLPPNYQLTEKEASTYYHDATLQQHLFEPNYKVFLSTINEDRPHPPLTIDRTRQLATLPIYRSSIGHRNPIPDAVTSDQLTSSFIYEGYQVPAHLSQPLREGPDPHRRLPNRISHDAFINLISFWQISLLDALDYLSWEYKRTDGWMPVHLETPELPRTAEVMDWIDAHGQIRIDRSWVRSSQY